MAERRTRRTRRSAGEDTKPPRSASAKKQKDDFNDDEIEEMLPKGLARTFVQSQLKSAKDQLASVGLTAPGDYEGEMPELPDDIDSVDHSELSNLMLRFQNALSTAIWNQSYHYIWQNTFEEIAEYMEAVTLTSVEGSNAEQRKGAARTDEKVVFFRARHVEHYNSYVRFRDTAKWIEGKIKAISRVGGFKDDGEDAEVLGAVKRSTRGTAKSSGRRRSRSS